MIYISADDYGLCEQTSVHIQQCIDKGALNKVSVFPNFDKIDLDNINQNDNLKVSLHINLVEGKCLSDAKDIHLLADKDGNFKHTFTGLLKLNMLCGKKLYEQAYREIKAQIVHWKMALSQDVPLCIDSHQHVHMIPSVFKALIRVLKDEKIDLDYLRIPAEPVLPYIKTPSLYSTYSVINIVKQWLLKFLWLLDKTYTKDYYFPKSYFFGILFSGKMDEKRVDKVLPEYIKMAEKNGKDIEILFHPGYLGKTELDLKNIAFKKFYMSENRKTEFDSVMKISMKEVYSNALYRTGQGGRENKGKVTSNH